MVYYNPLWFHRWLILFWYPKVRSTVHNSASIGAQQLYHDLPVSIAPFAAQDFTLVCPTEIIAFSDRAEEFRDLNCDLIAASTDTEEVSNCTPRMLLPDTAIQALTKFTYLYSAMRRCTWHGSRPHVTRVVLGT